MKIIAVPFVLLFTASLMSAEPAPVQPADAAKPVDPKAVSAKTVDPKAAKTVPKKDEKKKEEEPKIPGVLIPRAGGTWLAIEVIGGQFKLSFYDKKKKPAPVDVTRAIAVWPNPRAPGNNRTVLNVSGTALVGSKPVVPPYTFIVRLTLLKGDGDNAVAVENYAVQMH